MLLAYIKKSQKITKGKDPQQAGVSEFLLNADQVEPSFFVIHPINLKFPICIIHRPRLNDEQNRYISCPHEADKAHGQSSII